MSYFLVNEGKTSEKLGGKIEGVFWKETSGWLGLVNF